MRASWKRGASLSVVKVFISWSGDDSKHVAEALRTWLHTVLAGAVTCFVSSQDIRRGERGMDAIATELQDQDYGIVVLTRENMQSPWVNFEAGALGKTLGVGKVAPLLLDITRADVVGPISQFQSTLLTDREDFRQFIRDMAAMSPTIPEETIDLVFNSKWPELEAVVERAAGMKNPKTTRTPESMLEELLDLVRNLDRRQPQSETDKSVTTALSEWTTRNRRSIDVGHRATRDVLNHHAASEIRRALGNPDIFNVKVMMGLGWDQLSVETTPGVQDVDLESLQRTADDYRVRIVIESLGLDVIPREV